MVKEKILRVLKEAKGQYTSGEKLSDALGVSRTAIWKHINSLREAGYDILSVPRKGYILKHSPDLLTELEIQDGLDTTILGRRIISLDVVDSTNDVTKDFAMQNEEEGLVVIAEEQKKGKGRKGRSWASPKGTGIWMSVLLRPPLHPEHGPKFTLLTAVAVAEAIREETHLDVQIKWPNDLILNGRKVCGILSEMNTEIDYINYMVIGIGINVNVEEKDLPIDLRSKGISLSQVKGEKVFRQGLVKKILEKLERYYIQFIHYKNFDEILKRWRGMSCNIGRQVHAIYRGRDIIGRAIDVNTEGTLLIEQADGEIIEISYGEVSIRGMDDYI